MSKDKMYVIAHSALMSEIALSAMSRQPEGEVIIVEPDYALKEVRRYKAPEIVSISESVRAKPKKDKSKIKRYSSYFNNSKAPTND